MLKRCIIIIFIITTKLCVASESPPQITEASCPSVKTEQFTAADIAKFLSWVRDPKSCTLCGGRYVDPTNITNTPNPRGMQETPMNITSTEHALLVQSGTSVVKGNVTLTQPGREISADCITFFRDNKTNKITNSVLVGHVNFHEPGKLMVAQGANLNFVSEVHTLDNGLYRMLSKTPSGITNIWGRAKHMLRDAMGVLKMRHATYSSCPPDATSWHIWSNKLILDRNTGRGEAFNALFYFQKVPVFYTPYFNFPIDKRRKSGFLFPSMSTSKDSGLGLTLPYYFNLAPNYDATLTPTLFTKRGVFLDGLFNYLTLANSGTIDVNFIPHDRAFINFRDGFSLHPEKHTYSTLKNSSANRGLLRFQNDASFNEHWKGSLTGNYVTDDYFLQNFGSTTTTINDDQLFNQAEINYNNYNNYNNHQWRFASRVQGFQTLHRMAQDTGNSLAQDQYTRLPQLDLAGDFPDGFGGLNYQFDSGE
jgi:LPS-assembly protein